MATDGHPKEPQKSQQPFDERTLALMFDMLSAFKSELLGAFKDLKDHPIRQDPRERKTETISVLRSTITVHDEITAQRKVCQEEQRQAVDLQLDLFHAKHIKPLLTDIGILRKDIVTLCSDVATTTKSVHNGNSQTNNSFGNVQQAIQGLCNAIFGRKNDKGDLETTGLDATVKSIDAWKTKQEAAERMLDARKGDFRYWLDIVLKIAFWAGPTIISALTLWHTLAR